MPVLAALSTVKHYDIKTLLFKNVFFNLIVILRKLHNWKEFHCEEQVALFCLIVKLLLCVTT